MRATAARCMNRERGHLCDELLGAYIDGEIDGPSQQAADDHLRVCAACREAAAAMAALGAAARQADPPNWDVEGMVAMVASGIGKLEPEVQAGSLAGGANRAAVAGRASRACRWIQSRKRLALGFAAVAAILLASVLVAAGYAYRRGMIAEEQVFVNSHYIVRSGNVGALLVSYPGR